MSSRRVEIITAVGLHARPIAILVKAATKAGVAIVVGRVGQKAVPANSLLSVLALGLKYGEVVEVTVEDCESSEAILNEISTILAADYGD
jgi:phosphocarrier protein